MKQWKKRWRVICLMIAAILIVGGSQAQTAMATSDEVEVATQAVKKSSKNELVTQNKVDGDQGSQGDLDGDEDSETGSQPENTNPVSEGGNQQENTNPGSEGGNQQKNTNPVSEEGNQQENDNTRNETPSAGEDKPLDTETEDPDDTQPVVPSTESVVRVTIDGGTPEETADITEAWKKVDGRTATIELLKDVTTNAPCQLTGGDITLNLNGKTWSYGNSSSVSVRGQLDLIEVNRGKLTITDTSTNKTGVMQYTVNSDTSGACVSVGGGEAVIKGGTFSSSSSASIVIEDGTVSVEGGSFRNTKSGSAITVNGGTLDMSGGKVESGSLTLYKNNPKVTLGEGTEFAKIEFTGTTDAVVSEVLADDCGFRRISDNAWITDENTLMGTSIQNVKVDKKPIKSVTLSASPDQKEVPFSYVGGTEYTLTASAEATGSGSVPEYEWYRTYNGGSRELVQKEGGTYKFSTMGLDVGEYVYHVGVKADSYEEWKTYTINITPLPDGTVINNGYQTEYTYGDFVAPAINGGSSFSVSSEVPEGADLRWAYTWYRGDAKDDNRVNAPSDVGVYTLKVEAADAPNYKAVGEVQVTITQRTVTPRIEGTTTKVYDGTTEVKDARVELDNVVQGDSSGVGVKAASFAYNDANVSSANRIIASGIELTGNKAGNYKLSSTEAFVEAGITKARLIIQMNVSPNTQKINRPVTVTVTALNSDNSSMDNNGLKAEDIRLFVSGRNDTEEEHTLALTASGSRYGVYTAEYVTGIKGDKTFTAEIAGNANYEVSNVASDNTLTILQKTGAVMTLTANETEGIVYGDEVTYTAVVSKENEDDADALTGNVQFYENEIADDKKIGSAQRIIMSGDKASISLDESALTAGDHKILAVFSGSEFFEDASAEVSTNVAKKQLKWDVSDLTASKAAGTAGEVTVYGDLKLDGLLDEDDVKVIRPNVLTTNGLKSAEAGSYKVTVVSEDKEWKFDPEEPKNYELPEGDPEITAKVNAVKELPNPPADTEDGKKFKLVMEEGISTVPEGLLNTSFNTPAKIEEELKRVLTESGVYKPENTAVYDVVLQVSTDEGKTWQVADYTNFPEGGLLVTLPYPGGTGRYTNNFAVAHMFSSSYFGKTSGQVEIPAVRKTDNGMEFTVTGLSPIGLAWSGPMNAANSASNSRRAGGAATWDDNPILLYACLAGGAALAIVIVIIVCVVRSKKKKKKMNKKGRK